MRAGGWLSLAGLIAVASGCGSTTAAPPAEAPAFNALPRSGPVNTTMWRLADAVDRMNSAMTTPQPPDALQHKAVDILTEMNALATDLSQPEMRKKHALIADNVDFFRTDVREALAAAKADPPNYYLAGKVVGSCIHCHDPRGGIRTQ